MHRTPGAVRSIIPVCRQSVDDPGSVLYELYRVHDHDLRIAEPSEYAKHGSQSIDCYYEAYDISVRRDKNRASGLLRGHRLHAINFGSALPRLKDEAQLDWILHSASASKEVFQHPSRRGHLDWLDVLLGTGYHTSIDHRPGACISALLRNEQRDLARHVDGWCFDERWRLECVRSNLVQDSQLSGFTLGEGRTLWKRW